MFRHPNLLIRRADDALRILFPNKELQIFAGTQVTPAYIRLRFDTMTEMEAALVRAEYPHGLLIGNTVAPHNQGRVAYFVMTPPLIPANQASEEFVDFLEYLVKSQKESNNRNVPNPPQPRKSA